MNTLIVLSGLAVVILLLEIFNFRKGIIPLTVLGLGGAIAATLCPKPFVNTELYNMVHPSPLSAYRGFIGCNHFVLANNYLKSNGKKEIDW